MKFRNLLTVVLAAAAVVVYDTCVPIDGTTPFSPTGTTFNLSSGIQQNSLAPSTVGSNPDGYYAIDFVGRSTSGGTESQSLPAGLFLRSLNSAVQHLVLAKDFTITVPPDRDTTITLGTFSCNKTLQVGGPSDNYAFGPQTDNDDLKTIFAITRHKQIDSDLALVQEAILAVTEGAGLDQATINSLNALPEEP